LQNNVLIAADGSPRLADFGISNIMRQSDPAFSFHPGAVRWIAPECMAIPEEGTVQRGTKSGDIYALGCIILEVLSLIDMSALIDATCRFYMGDCPTGGSRALHTFFLQNSAEWNPSESIRPFRSSLIT